MNPVRVDDSIDVQTLAEIVEHCRAAGAAGSIVISSYNNIVVYYEDSQTKGAQDTDFADELHIRHQQNARVLIAVFPVNELSEIDYPFTIDYQ